jgi:hypothetical protein
LLDAAEALLETLRRSLTQSERLLERAATGKPLTPQETRDVRAEIDGTRAGIEQLEAMLTLRRQQMRRM